VYKVVVVVVVIVGVVNLLFLEIISAVDQLGKTDMKISSQQKSFLLGRSIPSSSCLRAWQTHPVS
jgi:hypothetical protein